MKICKNLEKFFVECKDWGKEERDLLQQLSKGVDANGNNINLSDTDYQRYLEIVDDIAAMMKEAKLDKDGKTVRKNKKKVENTVEVSSVTWDAIHKGMRLVVSDGTVRTIYKGMKVKVAGKTGTAEENKRRNTHSVFVCYAPYDNPEIAMATVIPYGDASSNASEVARDVIKYYNGEIELDDILKGNANEPEVESSHD